MPSSHATNAFAIAAFFGIPFKRYRWPLVCIAALIALSRVFCGVHYPGDIVVGAAVGVIVGAIMTSLFKVVTTRFPGPGKPGETATKVKED